MREATLEKRVKESKFCRCRKFCKNLVAFCFFLVAVVFICLLLLSFIYPLSENLHQSLRDVGRDWSEKYAQ